MFVRARKHRAQNRSVYEIHEDEVPSRCSSTELTPLSRTCAIFGEKCIFRSALLIVLLCSLSSAYTNAAGIYKWVDAEGNVHYGEQPPPGGAKEMPIRSSGSANQNNEPIPKSHVIDPKAQRDKMIQALEGDRLARQEKKQKLKKEQQKRKMQCARAKDTLRQYKSAASLYKLDAEGKRHTLPASVKQQETERLQAEINKWCK